MGARRRSAAVAIAGAALVAIVLSGCTAQNAVSIDVPTQVDQTLGDETVAELQDAVSTAMAATGSSGAIVGVWAPWSGTWVAGLGTQGPGGAEVSSDLGFRAANVTSAMTCDVIYRLAADGTLSLDDSVTTWVSNLPGFDDITLRMLCDGTSGLGSYSAVLQGVELTNPDRVWNTRELMAYGIASPRRNAPGASFAVSDTNYLLAGLAAERATGESLSSLIAERVASPLGLSATALPAPPAAPPAPSSLEGFRSQQTPEGWTCDQPQDVTVLSSTFGGAAAGAVTDITDLGRYTQALASKALLPADSDRFAAPVQASAEDPTWFTAAGGAFQAGSLIGQFGATAGYMVGAFADPETGMTVAVVLNNSAGNPKTAAWLSWELAAIASKAPAASGQTAPEAGLPWTAQQMRDNIVGNAICALPAQ